MLEYSRISAAMSVHLVDHRVGACLTDRSMLERQSDDILDPLEWRRSVRTRKTFSNNDLDPTKQIPSIPMSLLQNLRVEVREAQAVLVPVSIDIYKPVRLNESTRRRKALRELVSIENVSTSPIQTEHDGVPITYGQEDRCPKIPPLSSSQRSLEK